MKNFSYANDQTAGEVQPRQPMDVVKIGRKFYKPIVAMDDTTVPKISRRYDAEFTKVKDTPNGVYRIYYFRARNGRAAK